MKSSSLRLDAMLRGMWVPGGVEGHRLSLPTLTRVNAGLALPRRIRLEHRPAPIDYWGQLLRLEDYVVPSKMPGGSPEVVAEQILASQDPRILLLHLATLNRLCATPEETNKLVTSYRNILRSDLRLRFDEALANKVVEGGQDTLLFARQAVLVALRMVFRMCTWPEENLEEPSLATAILFAHAVSSSMSAFEVDNGQTIGHIPANLMMELVRNGILYEQDDGYSIIDRTLRYWQKHVLNLERTRLRDSAHVLLQEAIGIPFDDFFALGLSMWLRARAQNPLDRPNPLTWLADLAGIALPQEQVRRFLNAVSATPDWFSKQFEDRSSPYDFIPIQARPILRLEVDHKERLLVLDESFLLQTFTLTGLYWVVHDNERDHHNKKDLHRWTQAHGEVVERMVEESLQELAPSVSQTNGQKSFYTEEDLKRAYPGKKQSDAVVDYGYLILVIEIVGGQPVLGTRITGDPRWFKWDTEKLVLKKARQLHDTCNLLLTDQKKLTGYTPPSDRRIVPIVVVAGGYPSDALSRSHVDDLLQDECLLQDPAIAPLCLLDLAEIEMIESL